MDPRWVPTYARMYLPIRVPNTIRTVPNGSRNVNLTSRPLAFLKWTRLMRVGLFPLETRLGRSFARNCFVSRLIQIWLLCRDDVILWFSRLIGASYSTLLRVSFCKDRMIYTQTLTFPEAAYYPYSGCSHAQLACDAYFSSFIKRCHASR